MIVLVGPTASGKTEQGLRLARERHGEIVSVDSRQIYLDLTVGTAKPKGQWHGVPAARTYLVSGIPYHLVDFLNPDERFSAADFARLAETKIAEIRKRKRVPILVGGTGLYFKALLEGLAPMPPADPTLREALRERADQGGRAALHAELAKVDPEAASRIPANNIQRLIRALEVYHLTGRPLSAWHQEHRAASKTGKRLEIEEVIGLDPGKEALDQRIEKRCRAMMEEGLIEETQAVLQKGFAEDSPGLSGLGYPRVTAFLKNEISKDKALQLLIQDTRQYAKRQRTWFRHQMKGLEWKR